jgi:hypothetical protein
MYIVKHCTSSELMNTYSEYGSFLTYSEDVCYSNRDTNLSETELECNKIINGKKMYDKVKLSGTIFFLHSMCAVFVST